MTDKNVEKIIDALISYLEFEQDFKKVKQDDIISGENGDTYDFRKYNLECFIIDKKSFDGFRDSINFNKLIEILDPINDENKNKCKLELKTYLDKNPYIPIGDKVNIYSKEKEMKEIVKDFNNYTFVNKDLLIAMGVKESKLKDNYITISKNKNNTSLKSINNDFILDISYNKKRDVNINDKEKDDNDEKIINKEENKNYKILDYV